MRMRQETTREPNDARLTAGDPAVRWPGRAAAAAGFVAAALILSGCFVQLPTPGIDLMVRTAYNEDEILIPYSLHDHGSAAHARWTLARLDPETLLWRQIESREVRLPSGSSGVLELGYLEQGKHEIAFEMLTTRDRSYEVVPYLTQTREFYVDRSPPDAAGIGVQYYNNGTPAGAPLATATAELEVTPPPHNPNYESPVRILYTLNEPRPPAPERDELTSDRILLWESGGEAKATVIIVAIDAAGNRSGPLVEDWDL